MFKLVLSLGSWYLASQRSAREEIQRRMNSLPWVLLGFVFLLVMVGFGSIAGFLGLQSIGYTATAASLIVAGSALALMLLSIWRVWSLWRPAPPKPSPLEQTGQILLGTAEEMLQSFLNGMQQQTEKAVEELPDEPHIHRLKKKHVA